MTKWVNLASLQPNTERAYGRLKFWDHDRGYGYIETADGHCWASEREMQAAGVAAPVAGEYLSFRVIKSRGWIEAIDVRLRFG